MNAGMGPSEDGPIRPEDLDVTLTVRRELGAEREQAVIGEFLDRVGSAIDARVDARLDSGGGARTSGAARSSGDRRPSIALEVVSIVSGIPVTATALGVTGGSAGGILVSITAWVAIAAINIAHSRRR